MLWVPSVVNSSSYAATVALHTSLHGPFSPRVLTQRSW